MPVELKFRFGTPMLTQEADYILDASEEHAAEIDPRLDDGYVAKMRTLLGTLTGKTSGQKSKVADVANLTGAQNVALDDLNDLVSRAKESAKRAFAGQDVKLRNEFQVGITSPSDLASILSRARIVRDSCDKDTNAPVLAKKGWIAS